MIFLTVGLHTQGFERLIKKMDEIAKRIGEKVVMQIGYSAYEPKNATWFRFADNKEIDDLYKNARLVITHGGAGSILTALSYDKPLIVVPRLKKFSEHTDNHQVQLVQELEKEGILTVVYEINDLDKVLNNENKLLMTEPKSTRTNLINGLKKYINMYG